MEMSADEHGNPVHRLVQFGYGCKTECHTEGGSTKHRVHTHSNNASTKFRPHESTRSVMTKLNDTFELFTRGIAQIWLSIYLTTSCALTFSPLFFGTHFSEPFRAFASKNVVKELLLLKPIDFISFCYIP